VSLNPAHGEPLKWLFFLNDGSIPEVERLPVVWVWLRVFNTIFNNTSVISWMSVLLEEETEVPLPGENNHKGK
jgi:hypothetical protein